MKTNCLEISHRFRFLDFFEILPRENAHILYEIDILNLGEEDVIIKKASCEKNNISLPKYTRKSFFCEREFNICIKAQEKKWVAN